MRLLSLFSVLLVFLGGCKHSKELEAQSSSVHKDSLRFVPYFYFQYEPAQLKPDLKKKVRLFDARSNDKCYNLQLPFSDSLSPCGYCWVTGESPNDPVVLLDNAATKMPSQLTAFTMEFALRFDPDSMDTFRAGFVNGQVSISPGGIIFTLIDSTGKPDKKERLVIDKKVTPGITQYLYDGNWHHLAFVFRGATATAPGWLQLYVDGATAPSFRQYTNERSCPGGNRMLTTFFPDARSSGDALDEFAFWETPLPAGAILVHSRNFFKGEHYQIVFPAELDVPAAVSPLAGGAAQKADMKKYAPGYPEYSVSQLAQLQSFPLPRYRPGTSLQRNFPWYDFMYTSYEYSKAQEDTSGKIYYPGWKKPEHAAAALALDTEMYFHWHYLFLIPSPTFGSADYARPNTISGKLAQYADRHPEIQTATILFWTGIRPAAMGYDSRKPYITSNVNIDPCGDTLYPGIVRDGLTQQHNLHVLVDALPHRDSLRKIDFINENGEVFGQSRTPNAEGYRHSPLIHCLPQDSSNARLVRAHWQYKVFSTYSGQFVNTPKFPALLRTNFSFYQVAGFMPQYYADYAELRKVNAKFRGGHYATPDFYPGSVRWNIWDTHGPYHGLDVIEKGRKYELSLGDNYFSPFICAGWSADSNAYRPAEWLAANKALAMMGAEFFYAAYFNTSNPAKKMPQDPRGYIYQVAVPAYAQAVTSHFETIFLHSVGFEYRRNYNRIIIYRKDIRRPAYAIHTSIYESPGVSDSQEEFAGDINVDGTTLRVNFRPQGSTYIYDRSDPANIIFYQLDAWHEPTHPYYWSKDFAFEAEVSDDSFPHLLRTERPANAAANDYTTYTTYVRFSKENQQPLVFDFEPRQDADSVYYIWVRARSILERSSLLLVIDGKEHVGINAIRNGEFSWYCVEMKGKPMTFNLTSGKQHELKIKVKESFVDVDKVLISHSAKMPE